MVPGDVILGLASSGLHSNGFSLVRRVFVEGRENELDLPRVGLGGKHLGDVLLEPTRIYVRPVLDLLRKLPVKAMAHITGGGITENLGRVLPETCDARVVRGAWCVPRIYDLIAGEAELDPAEMYKTFNMGIGFAVVVDGRLAADASAALHEAGERAFEVGEIVEGSGRVTYLG